MRVRFLAHVEVPSFGRCFDLLDLCFFAPLNDGRLRGSGDPISEYSLFCPMVTIYGSCEDYERKKKWDCEENVQKRFQVKVE